MFTPRPRGLYYPGDVFQCFAGENDRYRQSYRWTDSQRVILSNSSETTLSGRGSFNWTCTVTDERLECDVLKGSIAGQIYSKLIVNVITRQRNLADVHITHVRPGPVRAPRRLDHALHELPECHR